MKTGFTQSRNYAIVRGFIGVFFICFGIVIGTRIVMQTGLDFKSLPGVALAAAMIALGIVRIRGAIAAVKSAP